MNALLRMVGLCAHNIRQWVAGTFSAVAPKFTIRKLRQQIAQLQAANAQLSRDCVHSPFPACNDPITVLPPPSSGVITLVFSDVQGSTSQWEQHPTVMAGAIILHNKVIRDLLCQYGGYEVKTHGDSFMVAFQRPDNAVRWCLAVQNALFNAPWDEHLMEHPDSAQAYSLCGVLNKRGLRVRMGVHTGVADAVVVDPITSRMDYLGQMVNKASRIAGLAVGGQIVISQSIWNAIQPAADSMHVSAKYLGTFELKGITNKERIYEVCSC
jgi:class 3 adenylate cyclase